MSRPRLNVLVYGTWLARIIVAGSQQSEIEWIKADPLLNGKRVFVPNSAIGPAWDNYVQNKKAHGQKTMPMGSNRPRIDRPIIKKERPSWYKKPLRPRFWQPRRTPEL
jgi:hypothetical protein